MVTNVLQKNPVFSSRATSTQLSFPIDRLLSRVESWRDTTVQQAPNLSTEGTCRRVTRDQYARAAVLTTNWSKLESYCVHSRIVWLYPSYHETLLVRWSRPCSPRPHDIASIDFNTSTPLYDVNRAGDIPLSSSSLHWSIDSSSFRLSELIGIFPRNKTTIFLTIDHASIFECVRNVRYIRGVPLKDWF